MDMLQQEKEQKEERLEIEYYALNDIVFIYNAIYNLICFELQLILLFTHI